LERRRGDGNRTARSCRVAQAHKAGTDGHEGHGRGPEGSCPFCESNLSRNRRTSSYGCRAEGSDGSQEGHFPCFSPHAGDGRWIEAPGCPGKARIPLADRPQRHECGSEEASPDEKSEPCLPL